MVLKCKFCEMSLDTKYPIFTQKLMYHHVQTNHGHQLQAFIRSFFVEEK